MEGKKWQLFSNFPPGNEAKRETGIRMVISPAGAQRDKDSFTALRIRYEFGAVHSKQPEVGGKRQATGQCGAVGDLRNSVFIPSGCF